MKDERRHYRALPLYEGQLAVDVVFDEDKIIPAHVIDVSIGGIGVFIDAEKDLGLEAGQHVFLRLTSPSLAEDVTTPGAVRRCTRTEGGVTYGFEFVDWMGLLSQLPAEVRVLFNQRSEFRVGVGPYRPIEVRGMTSPFRAEGILHDISPDGLCFHVPMGGEDVLSPGRLVRIDFRLPGVPQSLSFVAQIRHSEWNRGRFYCGVHFNSERTEEFRKKQGRVAEFVIETMRGARSLPASE